MAEIAWEIEALASGEKMPDGVVAVVWKTLANLDTGKPFILPAFADKSVQVHGTFGAGGNCRIKGSNFTTGTPTWATLNDPQGNALDVTAAKIEQILENPYQIQPEITAGDGTTSLTVRLLASTVARR